MVLLHLIKKEIQESPQAVIGFLILTSLSNALLLKTINDATDDIFQGEMVTTHFLGYLLCVAIYIFSRQYIFDKAFEFVERTVIRLQNRLGNKIRHTELSTLEKVGEEAIHARLTEDMTYISLVSWSLARVIHALFVIASVLIYIALLSIWAFIFVLIGVLVAILNYVLRAERAAEHYFNLSKREANFLQKLNDIFKGFKAIKINKEKSDEVFEDYKENSQLREEARVISFCFYNENTSFAYACFFVMITVIIFVMPYYHEEYPETIVKIAAAILFVFGPIESFLNALPPIAITEHGAQNILNLEEELNSALKTKQPKDIKEKTVQPIFFEKNIHLEGLTYEYEAPKTNRAFRLGPISCHFQKGEIVFITGGNGSGKSTFLKMLLGLYLPKSGQLYLDKDLENEEEGTLITPANYVLYRNFFTTIFADYHLFDRLYGVPNIDTEKVNQLIQSMGLAKEKTTFKDGRFTNINLSSGQKKRLALATCILEDKDIFIFDEVAADLDPEFRDTYYYEILAELKARNKLVFVVSHDKEYWNVADRIIQFKQGQMKELFGHPLNEASI